MVQGLAKVGKKKRQVNKADKRNRTKATVQKARVGLVKASKKGADARRPGSAKMNQKLSGAITNHIEEIMMARVNEDRGQTASSSMKVLKDVKPVEKVKPRARRTNY